MQLFKIVNFNVVFLKHNKFCYCSNCSPMPLQKDTSRYFIILCYCCRMYLYFSISLFDINSSQYFVIKTFSFTKQQCYQGYCYLLFLESKLFYFTNIVFERMKKINIVMLFCQVILIHILSLLLSLFIITLTSIL